MQMRERQGKVPFFFVLPASFARLEWGNGGGCVYRDGGWEAEGRVPRYGTEGESESEPDSLPESDMVSTWSRREGAIRTGVYSRHGV